MKKCSKCKEFKNFEQFSKNKTTKDGLQSSCKDCNRKYRKENIEQIKEYSKKYFEENKKDFKEYYKENRERIIQSSNSWREDNRERYNECERERRRERRATDPLFKLRCYLATRTWGAFKYKNIKKNSRTHELLGIEWDELKIYIEHMFTDGMTWENYGEWHIDHIYPLSRAKDENHLEELCHYTNLQPLWAEENLSKGNKIL